ncbi:MAG TPA: NACHT domain-containing protein [Nostocaceae cyanobacterium]|nr:NACHT domain-containing protein [Nostocaceae cyanobacterium]
MASSDNKLAQQEIFLRELADEYGLAGDTLIAFLERFNRYKKEIINSELAKKINSWNKLGESGDKEQKLEEELQNIYSALKADCPQLPSERKRGRPKKDEEPWLIVYNWLWKEKWPKWQQIQNLETQNTVISNEQTQKEAVCNFLKQIINEFQYIKLFHTQQNIILKNQYIPIQVTLERKYTHTIETTWSYAESTAELNRAYSLKSSEDEQRTQVDCKEAKKQHKRLIVLADPGMGKTTLLKLEAYSAAQEALQNLENNSKNLENIFIPIFLRLSEIAEATKDVTAKVSDAIFKLLESKYERHFLEIRTFLESQLKAGKCLLLLDALDEAPKDCRNSLADKLNTFLNNYDCKIICTSRIVGYSGTFLNSGKDVEIVPFNQPQIKKYIQTWFNNAAEYLDDHSVSAASLIRELENKPQIRGLVQNPLLLSLICSLYQEKGLTLPARRCEIYEKAVNYMLAKWTQNRQPQNEGRIKAKIRLLEQLAYNFSCADKEIFTTDELYDQIEEYLQSGKVASVFRNADTDEIITELSVQDGILTKLHEDGKEYLFLHRTFQEYLTACYLQRSSDCIELAKAHFWDFEWHETLSLMAGLMKNPISLLEAVLQKKDDIFLNLLLNHI